MIGGGRSLPLMALMALVAVSGPAGCGWAPGDVPGVSWGNYLAGDDLRLVCDDGAPDRFRIVFHDRAERRLRTFDILEDRELGGAEVAARILTDDDMSGTEVGDDFNGWRGTEASLHLEPVRFADLARRLDALGAFDPPPIGGRSRPNGVKWMITGCRGGEWFFNAFADPADVGLMIRSSRTGA